MTELEMRKKVANYLVQYAGCAEGGASHRAILNTFNNSGLCSRYKMTVNDAWCATAVSAAFIGCGYAGAPGSGKLFECVECDCDAVITKAKRQGIWEESDAYTPRVGDVLLYDWNDSGYGDNTGSADHIGIVYAVSGNKLTIIEGNISNTVGYRTMYVNARYIRGYVAPNYTKFASGSTPSPARAPFSIASGVKRWTNGSTAEPVYRRTDLTDRIGTINPGEQLWCVGRIGDAYLVYYWLDDTDWTYAVGCVAYHGGTSF